MSDNQNKKAGKIKQLLPLVLFVLIGAVCGFFIGKYILKARDTDLSIGEVFLNTFLLFIGMYIAIYSQIVIHEGGHLIFGLMTGYRFLSFRIGSIMILKKDKKLGLKKLSIAGTGGQCLLAPCDMKDGRYPYVLYNFGGAITNLLSVLLFSLLAIFGNGSEMVQAFLMMLIFIGLAFALINGIPLKLGTINNDGCNALAIGKDKEAMRAFWIQLKVNEELASGIRLKYMPEEWFVLPSEESMKNSMVALIGVLACNRLMDQMRFTEAKDLMEKMIKMESGMVGLHRSLMKGDLIYCELLSGNDKEKIDGMLDKNQKKIMKAMKNYPTVLRTEYVYELFNGNDKVKVEQLKASFDKMAKTYPYPCEIESERELMEYANEKYEALLQEQKVSEA